MELLKSILTEKIGVKDLSWNKNKKENFISDIIRIQENF